MRETVPLFGVVFVAITVALVWLVKCTKRPTIYVPMYAQYSNIELKSFKFREVNLKVNQFL